MSNESDPVGAGLDLDHADFGSGDRPACAACSSTLSGHYYTLADRMLCEACYHQISRAVPPGSVATRALGALGLGLVAAVAAGALWMLVTELTGYEIGLVAIVVGFLVGAAVRLGGRHVGGIGYQLLAVFLTYLAIVMTYVPMIVAELRSNDELSAQLDGSATDPALVEVAPDGAFAVAPARDEAALTLAFHLVAIPLAFAAPFLLGFDNIIGILIIAFALYQAWKMNARVKLDLRGPFQLGAGSAPLD